MVLQSLSVTSPSLKVSELSTDEELILFYLLIHTYIIGHYNPSVRIIDLVSHTTYGECLKFIHKREDLQWCEILGQKSYMYVVS